jgi:putative hydroxymethylpyrimidine transport system permease protein
MNAGRLAVTAVGLLVCWQLVVSVAGTPHYILPGPLPVLRAVANNSWLILSHAGTTLSEILAGLALGILLGGLSALNMVYFRPARRWLLPLMVISQAIPVFAIAPLLVLWFGYGMASKIAMATLIIYFPVTASLYDGLRQTEPGWLDLARTMTAGHGRARLAILWHIRLPASLPSLATGIRVAAATAPIGAVVGEWVGSSAGLGYLMLHAGGRMKTDLMFAALLALSLLALAIYFVTDGLLRRLVPWQALRALDMDHDD